MEQLGQDKNWRRNFMIEGRMRVSDLDGIKKSESPPPGR